jgi:hypothetical protein
MSFLNSIGGAAGAAGGASGAASGLGHLIGADPSRISSIANSIGTGMNGIAAAGGAAPGYNAPGHAAPAASAAAPDNHMQLLDQDVIQQIIQQFAGRPQAAPQMGYNR